MTETPPVWIAFPELTPEDSLNQGAGARYIDFDWLPFWMSLSAPEKEAYLDRWNASPEWREVIHERFDEPSFDMEEDMRESEEWLRNHPPKPKASLWARLFGQR